MWPLKEVKSPASVSNRKDPTGILDPSLDPSLDTKDRLWFIHLKGKTSL